MSGNNINWLGNKVVDPSSERSSIASSANRTSSDFQQKIATVLKSSKDSEQNGISIKQNDILNPPLTPMVPIVPPDQQGPPPINQPGYVPFYLKKNIGKFIRAEFIINNTNIDKTGRLIEVGVNYFVLEDVNSGTHIMCDLYSAKFVTVIMRPTPIIP